MSSWSASLFFSSEKHISRPTAHAQYTSSVEIYLLLTAGRTVTLIYTRAGVVCEHSAAAAQAAVRLGRRDHRGHQGVRGQPALQVGP